MSLQEYRAKRRLDQSPEPAGSTERNVGPLRFVVQRHLAKRLHFDLRLEAGGVLKSWALPKGPSLDPKQKRLAIQVEDHPLQYLRFQGAIPQGNYGAGTVAIWDTGTYQLPEVQDRRAMDQAVERGVREGKLHVLLYGTKLQGEFILTKLKRGKDQEWLFFKKRDAFASELPLPDNAVVPIAGTHKPPAMPTKVKPMLATPVAQPFDHNHWLYELKWDGYRAIAEVGRAKVRLYSRKGLSFEQRYPAIVEALAKLGHEAVLDGEIVVLDDAGAPQFQLLQNYGKDRRSTLMYQVFDLLYLDGHDLRDLPLLRRKELLAHILKRLPHVGLSEHIREHGIPFFAAVAAKGLEGMVAKDVRSRYQPGVRSRSWLKIKTHLRQEAVIVGYTEPRGRRQGFGALVLGVYAGDELKYIGHAGSGFTAETLGDLRERLSPLIRTKCPFKKLPKSSTLAHWVEPRLVCEVTFAGWTAEGHMRHPVYVGLRDDKLAADVRREEPEPAAEMVADVALKPRPSAATTDWDARPNKQLTIGGRDIALTNLAKLYWPEDGLAKGDLLEYYRQTADVIVPYLRDRPLSLHRHPDGVHGESFFQKDVRHQPPPEWVKTIDLRSDTSKRDTILYVLCQDAATLLYLANLGCIEMNPWNSRTAHIARPDYAVIDLDPEDVAFDQVVVVAQMVRQTLDRVGAVGYCKTSGKRGLHIYVPFGARYPHEQARNFAELIARLVQQRLPHLTSLARSPAQRQQRVYLDYLQNGHGKTIAAPYSVRPYSGATVSTPLRWAEVKRGLNPALFTIRTLAQRLDKIGDLWAPVLGPGIDLTDCLDRLSSFLAKEVPKGKRDL